MAATKQEVLIEPQPGPQTAFLTTSADICGYGGAAGGGKSFGLLIEALRHVNNPEFGWVIFRRTYPEIKNEGGLWDEATKLFPFIGAIPTETTLEWDFPSGAKGKFAHMQHEKDKYSWQGSQICFIGFDEATHFTRSQVFYMISRNRSTCGVKPYVRLTFNPDADSWVKTFFAPWVHEDWPAEDRAQSGEIRWFVIDGDELQWLPKDGTYPNEEYPYAKSVTFIEADVYDNPKLLEKDPGYLANLHALPLVERERLLHKNWQIRAEGGNKFKRAWFPILDYVPDDIEKVARFWDLAATEETPANSERDGPDYTASVKMARRKAGSSPRYVVLHVTWDRRSPGQVETMVRNLAEQDGPACEIYLEEEPGSAGKNNTYNYKTKVLEGFFVHGIRATGPKEIRANVASSQAEVGNIGILRAHWNDGYFGFLEPFPSKKIHDDPVDATSGVMEQLFIKMSSQDHLRQMQRRSELAEQRNTQPTQDNPLPQAMLLSEKKKAWWQ